jgi:hypothetical protein
MNRRVSLGRLTPQVSGDMDPPSGSGPDSRGDRAADDHTTCRSRRSSARPPSSKDLRAWAAALAATLPPLTESQVAAVARLAAHLDANDNQKRAA